MTTQFVPTEEKLEKMMRQLKLKLRLFLVDPVRIGIRIFLLFTLVVIIFSWSHYSNLEFWKDVTVEAHGMLMDLLIIGVITLWLNEKGRKEIEINRNKYDIGIFKDWKSETSAYLILKAIVQLNQLKVFAIDISWANLKWLNHLLHIRIIEGSCSWAIFDGIGLAGCVFDGSDFIKSSFKKTIISASSFRNCDMSESNFDHAQIMSADFSNANLQNTSFKAAKLNKGIDFFQANLSRADLLTAEYIDAETLSKASSLYGTKIEESLKQELLEKYPHLFKETPIITEHKMNVHKHDDYFL